jgi:drug/metabolite transporter (DMT)-like permease
LALVYPSKIENRQSKIANFHPHPVRGYFYIATATFLWGVAAAIGRAAFTGRLLPQGEVLRPIDPLILSQSRTTFSFLLLAGVLGVARGWRRLRLPAADFGRMFVLGILGVAASNYFYYLAIQRTNVATAIILQYTAPVWVLLYTVARGLQKPSLRRVMAVILALSGIALVIGIFGTGGFRRDTIGVTAAMLAAFSFAFYNIGGHSVLTRYDRWTVLLYVILSASLFWIVINPPWKIAAAHYSPAQWLFLLVFSLISVLAPFAFYFAGLQYLEPTRAIVVSCLEPVFSIVIAAVALGEVMRPLQSVGIILVLIAIVVVQMPDRKLHESVAVVEPME